MAGAYSSSTYCFIMRRVVYIGMMVRIASFTVRSHTRGTSWASRS